MKISMDKTYTNRDGREVVLYAIYPGEVHGAIKGINGSWSVNTWSAEGSYFLDGTKSHCDLVEAVVLPEYWVIFWEKGDPTVTTTMKDDISDMKCVKAVVYHEGGVHQGGVDQYGRDL